MTATTRPIEHRSRSSIFRTSSVRIEDALLEPHGGLPDRLIRVNLTAARLVADELQAHVAFARHLLQRVKLGSALLLRTDAHHHRPGRLGSIPANPSHTLFSDLLTPKTLVNGGVRRADTVPPVLKQQKQGRISCPMYT